MVWMKRQKTQIRLPRWNCHGNRHFEANLVFSFHLVFPLLRPVWTWRWISVLLFRHPNFNFELVLFNACSRGLPRFITFVQSWDTFCSATNVHRWSVLLLRLNQFFSLAGKSSCCCASFWLRLALCLVSQTVVLENRVLSRDKLARAGSLVSSHI